MKKEKTYGNLLGKIKMYEIFKISREALRLSKNEDEFYKLMDQKIQDAEQKLKEQATALYFEDIEK